MSDYFPVSQIDLQLERLNDEEDIWCDMDDYTLSQAVENYEVGEDMPDFDWGLFSLSDNVDISTQASQDSKGNVSDYKDTMDNIAAGNNEGFGSPKSAKDFIDIQIEVESKQ